MRNRIPTEGGNTQPADDDVIDLAPRRLPRWLVALAAAAAIATVTAVAVTHHHARESRPPTATFVPPPQRLPAVTSELGDALPLDTKPVLDVAVAGDRSWVLQSGQLDVFDVDSANRRASVGGIDFNSVISSVRLVLDAPARRAWVVVLNTPEGKIIEFDGRLHRIRTAESAAPISAAAALDGHLYLGTTSGVIDLAPGARGPEPVPGVRGYVGALAADRARSRVLALVHPMAARSGGGARVVSFGPGAKPTEGAATLPFGKGDLGVTAEGAVWAGGFGRHGAVLVRLDPATLALDEQSQLADDLGPGALIVASGHRVVWVRSGAGGTALYCVDGETGLSSQVWSAAPGNVASDIGTAYLATGSAAVALDLDGCAG